MAVAQLRHADQVLRRELGAEQRDAGQPERHGEGADQGALADSRRAPQEYRPTTARCSSSAGSWAGVTVIADSTYAYLPRVSVSLRRTDVSPGPSRIEGGGRSGEPFWGQP